MAVWRNCDDGRVVGIRKREMGGADGGGWSSRPLGSRITLKLTAHHSPTVNAPNLHCAAPDAIRAVEEPVGMRWSCARGCQCC